MKCLVTGGAGFVGSNLVDRLVAEGHKVRVLDNLSTGNRSNLSSVGSKIEWILGDLRDGKAVRKAVRGVDYVFHLAANRAVLRSVDDPRETNDINITGTLNVLTAARDFRANLGLGGRMHRSPVSEFDRRMVESLAEELKKKRALFCGNRCLRRKNSRNQRHEPLGNSGTQRAQPHAA